MAHIKRKPRKVILGKPTAKEAKPTKIAQATTRTKASRFEHGIDSTYAGISPVFTSRKSRTPLRTEDFGSAPDLVLSERDEAALVPLRSEYGNRRFPRGNVDAGILNRAIRKGVVRHVSGDPTHESAQLQFVGR